MSKFFRYVWAATKGVLKLAWKLRHLLPLVGVIQPQWLPIAIRLAAVAEGISTSRSERFDFVARGLRNELMKKGVYLPARQINWLVESAVNLVSAKVMGKELSIEEQSLPKSVLAEEAEP